MPVSETLLPRRLRTTLLVVAWLCVVAAFALVLAESQQGSRQVLEQRQEARASTAARFIGTYARDVPGAARRPRTLDAYLRSTGPAGARVSLLDGAGRTLAHAAPAGRLRAGEPELVLHRAVPGTSWRLVVRVPERVLYASVEGRGRWLPWAAVGALGIVGLGVTLLISWLLAGRARLAWLNRQLDHLARIDPLTGLYNQRHIDELLDRLISGARRHGAELSVLVIDVDHFKQVNDRHGHQAGDEILRRVALRLRAALRHEDVVGRWGGEEFLAVLPDSDEAAARATAERLRRVVANQPYELAEGTVQVTVTIGVAAWDGHDAQQLVREADLALFGGKAAGRDVVHV